MTGVAKPGANALAVLVSAPKPSDLAITFVDWNPMPPDKVMGLYRPVTLTATGPVALRHPQVVTKLNPPANDRAELTVKVFATNATRRRSTGTLQRAAPPGVAFQKDVALAAGRVARDRRRAAGRPGARRREPEALVAGPVRRARAARPRARARRRTAPSSDRATRAVRHPRVHRGAHAERPRLQGERPQASSIRGAGWTSEMMLRYSPERYEQEIAYVKDMGLNTIRLEGKLEDEPFFDVTDREGILVMPGWCCCDHWEQWDKWDAEDLPVATASLRDQVLRLRGRASVFTWLNGSDGPPPAKVEQAYLDVLKETGFPNPVVSSATEKKAEVSGESGMKMRGPYEWVPPLYWYTDTKLGGPHGFATEIGPGPAPPPLESLKRFIPEDKLWPINEAWNYHCGGGPFKTLDVFTKAMDARYGPVEGRRGVRAQGPGRGLRVAPRHARVLRRAEVHGHRRHPVDAEQRLAGDDLAPLRLLPAAGRLVLRREEGRRAAARAVRLRRPLGRRRQRHAAGAPRA